MSFVSPRVILAVLMLIAGVAILGVSCVLVSWYSTGAEKESILFAIIGSANVFGAWRLVRISAKESQARQRSQQAALLLIPILTLYLAAYAILGIRICGVKEKDAQYCGFVYDYAWESRLFYPAAAAESLLFRRNIFVATESEIYWKSPVRQSDK